MAAPLHLLYFAWLRERTGCAEETLPRPDEATDVAGLMRALATRHPRAFANPASIRCAVNQEFATPTTAISDGDEVAFFPPVTGG